MSIYSNLRFSLCRDRRGQALILLAVSIVVVLAAATMAVDLARAFAARAAAQRAADSAALAGASAFLDYSYTDPTAVEEANARAMEFATSNDVQADGIDPSQVTVWVDPDEQKVRVRVEETGMPTWFAQVLNIFSMDVAAAATAVGSDGGATSQCVLPFAIPDLWDDMDDDLNGNEIPDEGEQWFFENEREASDGQSPDVYVSFADNRFDATGFGSTFRDNETSRDDGFSRVRDYGRRLVLKSQEGEGGPATGGSEGGGWTPATSGELAPGNFQLWVMPDPESGCSEGSGGAKWLWWNVDNCNTCLIELGADYPTEAGDVESLKHPLSRLFEQDPDAHWVDDADGGHIAGSIYGVNPEQNSPLVRVIPIFSPEKNFSGTSVPLEFVNFAKVFIEPGDAEGTIYARFLGPVKGTSRGSTNTGSLVKDLRLVN